MKKIMSAVTDSVGKVQLDKENQPGLYNLIEIGSALSGRTMEDIVNEFQGEGYGKLKGSSTKADTWYPDFNPVGIDFNTSLYDVAFRYEYNFWPYGTGREYHGAQRLTPFIAIGLGLSVSSSKLTQNGVDMKRTAAAGQMPVGIGVKYKMGDRWNLAVEWTMHFTGNDKLDGIADPYDITSSGLFKNTDCYSLLGVTITYDLWAKCKTCHNDRD